MFRVGKSLRFRRLQRIFRNHNGIKPLTNHAAALSVHGIRCRGFGAASSSSEREIQLENQILSGRQGLAEELWRGRDLTGALRAAHASYGSYGELENRKAWQMFAKNVLATPPTDRQSAIDIAAGLANADFAQASFWERYDHRVCGPLFDSFNSGATLEELVELGEAYLRVKYRSAEVLERIWHLTDANGDHEFFDLDDLTPDQWIRLLDVVSAHAHAAANKEKKRIEDIAALDPSASKIAEPFNRKWQDMYHTVAEVICDDFDKWSPQQLTAVLRSFGKMKLTHLTFFQEARRRLHRNLGSLTGKEIADIADAYRYLSSRHDTFFKTVTQECLVWMEHQIQKESRSKDLKESSSDGVFDDDFDAFEIEMTSNHAKKSKRSKELAKAEKETSPEVAKADAHGDGANLRQYSAGDVARIARAMCKLRIGTVGEGTTWWKSGEDRMSLLKGLDRGVRAQVENMSCYELACAALALSRHTNLDDPKFCQLMLDAFLAKLEDDPLLLQGGQKHLPDFLWGIVHIGKTKRKDTRGMDLKPLAVWVPKHVSGLTLAELSAINMHLAELGWSEHEYYMAFVPYLTDRVPDLSQEDITWIQNTYNKVRLFDRDMGRHFFWSLGKRFQEIQASRSGMDMPKDILRIG